MIDELLKQWRATWDEMESDDFVVFERARIARLEGDLADWRNILNAHEEAYRTKLAELEAQMKPLVTGKVQAHGVEVTYRKGYAKVTWDSKKLDGYAAAHPEVLPFRAETQVAASVSFKAVE